MRNKNNNRKCDVEGDQFTDSANGQPLNFFGDSMLKDAKQMENHSP